VDASASRSPRAFRAIARLTREWTDTKYALGRIDKTALPMELAAGSLKTIVWKGAST
jgi:hypothetical protein